MALISEERVPPAVSYPSPSGTDDAEAALSHRFTKGRADSSQAEIRYQFTNDPGFLHQYYRLREEMFINVWGLERFSGQKDEFDDASYTLVARKGLQCIAGGRLSVSRPRGKQMMPMEKSGLRLASLFPDLDLSKHNYGEFSRLAILPEFRAGMIFPEISSIFIKKAISLGVEYAFNVAPIPLARNYRQAVQHLGLKWELRYDIAIPELEEYEGIKMIMSVMDLTGQARTVSKARRAAVPAPA